VGTSTARGGQCMNRRVRNLFGFKQKQHRKILFENGVCSLYTYFYIACSAMPLTLLCTNRSLCLSLCFVQIVGKENSAELTVGRMRLPLKKERCTY